MLSVLFSGYEENELCPRPDHWEASRLPPTWVSRLWVKYPFWAGAFGNPFTRRRPLYRADLKHDSEFDDFFTPGRPFKKTVEAEYRLESEIGMDATEFLRRLNDGEKDLRGIALSSAALLGCDLRFVNLARAHLREVDLWGANATAVNFSEAQLVRVRLAAGHLFRASFHKVQAPGIDLAGANLHAADFTGANLSQADLRAAQLTNADLRGANLSGAVLRGAHLTEADFRGANLRGSNLIETIISKTRFDGADLRGVRWEE
ncbi:MAG: pentapeptide repeat-containing protein [Acidobacteriota bacterium]